MYNLKVLLLGLSFFSAGLKPMSLDTNEGMGDMAGIYTSADDFVNNRLSYTGDCMTGNCRFRLRALFGSSTVAMICNGKEQVIARDSVYGYRDCKAVNYRFFGGSIYRIVDTAGFYLYSINKLVQGQKIARPQTVYYFSVTPGGVVQELTIAGLKQAFADNTSFRYRLDAQFRSDKELTTYDDHLRRYKLKYLYSESKL